MQFPFNTVKYASVAGAMVMMMSGAHSANLKIGTTLEPPHLDPTAGAAAAIDEVTYQNVFEGLVRITANAEIAPALAKSWTVSGDGLTYTFQLQQGVKFHDGTAFDADDVVYTFNRITAGDSVNASKKLYTAIEKVTAVDKHTVRIELSEKIGDFIYRLTYGDAVMVAPESAQTNKKNPIGTGAFQFKTWRSGSHVVLDKFDGYWGKSPSINSVEFRFIKDTTAVTSALLAGDIDGYANIGALETVAMFESDPRFTVLKGNTEGETILAMNNKRGILQNKTVRQAISHAVNRKDVIDGASYGYGVAIGTHFAPHHPAYVDLTGLYAYDMAKSKSMIADAGVSGKTLEMVLPPTAYARRGGEIIASQLRQVGFKVNITPVEWAVWLKRVFKQKDYDLTIVSHVEPMDIEIYSRPNYYFQYQNPKFNAVISKLNGVSDISKRHDLYRQAQRMIAEDAVNVYLYQMPRVGVWKKEVKGIWKDTPQPSIVVTGVTVK